MSQIIQSSNHIKREQKNKSANMQ